MTDQSDGSMTPSPPAGSDWHQRLRGGWWFWSEGRPFRHGGIFTKASSWLVLVIVFFLYGSKYQVTQLAGGIYSQSLAPSNYEIHAGEQSSLRVAFPRKMPAGLLDDPVVPMAVWQLQATPTVSPTLTPALSPTLTPAVPLPPAEKVPDWYGWLRDLWKWLLDRFGVGGAVLLIPIVIFLVLLVVGVIKKGPEDVYQTVKRRFASFGRRLWQRLCYYWNVRKKKNELVALLGRDLSEGARYYSELLQSDDSPWNEPYVQAYLERAWEKTAPVELQHVVGLVQVSRDVNGLLRRAEAIGRDKIVAALEWAREMLDEDWQPMISGLERSLGRPFIQEPQDKPWYAALRSWQRFFLWQDIQTGIDPAIESTLQFLELKGNPFSSARAETDPLLFVARLDMPWLRDLRVAKPTVITGASGAGKTAAALLLAYDCLRDREFFPVYCLVEHGASALRALLDDVAHALSTTLVHYLAVEPAGFLGRGTRGQTAIAHLFHRYVGSGDKLALIFEQAGLFPVGHGREALEKVLQLTEDASLTALLIDDELQALISEAYPQAFRQVLILIDVQTIGRNGTATSAEFLCLLLDLMDCLARAGVIVKTFLPDGYAVPLRQMGIRGPVALEWEDGSLLQLLKKRLVRFGDDSLATWCDPGASSLSPDKCIVNAARGTPGRLIEKGNELLSRITQTRAKLTAEDLEQVLGALPELDNEVDGERAG